MEGRVEHLRRMLVRNPDHALGHYMLGLELGKLGRWGEAADELRRALALNPDHTAAYRDLGRALAHLGAVEEARRTYEEGLRAAERTGELQTGREIRVFLGRLDRGN